MARLWGLALGHEMVLATAQELVVGKEKQLARGLGVMLALWMVLELGSRRELAMEWMKGLVLAQEMVLVLAWLMELELA